LIVIVLVAKFLQRFKENENVKHIFYGLRPASTALIAAAGIEVVKISLLNMELWGKDYVNLVDWKGFVLAAVLFFAMEKYKRHPFFYILAAGVIGIVIGQLN
jgi:chromate transporter